MKVKLTREELEQYLLTMNDPDIAELVGVSRSRIQQIRKAYDLSSSRIPQGQRQGALDATVDKETLETLLLTMNDTQIAAHFGVSRSVIFRLRGMYGLAASTIPIPTNRVHLINHAYFRTIDEPKKAYILGFIIADGSVSKDQKRLFVGVAERDMGLLYIMRSEIGSTQPIFLRTPAGSSPFRNTNQYGIQFHSTQLVQDLVNLGVVPNKTEKTYLPAVPPSLLPHLIRGILEGDGHIDATRFSILGSPTLIQNIHDAILEHTGISVAYGVAPNSRSGLYRMVGYKRDKPVLNWLYQDSSIISLVRKRERWMLHWR